MTKLDPCTLHLLQLLELTYQRCLCLSHPFTPLEYSTMLLSVYEECKRSCDSQVVMTHFYILRDVLRRLPGREAQIFFNICKPVYRNHATYTDRSKRTWFVDCYTECVLCGKFCRNTQNEARAGTCQSERCRSEAQITGPAVMSYLQSTVGQLRRDVPLEIFERVAKHLSAHSLPLFYSHTNDAPSPAAIDLGKPPINVQPSRQ
eukprot:TRINITY_DN7349_c0_g2_i1.p1 TRINITY_DN7349_c0_g2~~TRINITY_DN7349_c0_g2_i1.p1  ORF type:complete len:204 (+),score=7.50 TRINITY_DN7349_c0_g2_i1:167-778(+)